MSDATLSGLLTVSVAVLAAFIFGFLVAFVFSIIDEYVAQQRKDRDFH